MASYQKRGLRSWLLVVETGADSDKFRDKETKTIRVPEELLKTPKKLEQHLDEELLKFKIEVETGVFFKADNMKFSDFVPEWKKKFAEKHLEETSQGNYLFHLEKRILPYFGHMLMQKIKPLHIETYLDDLSQSEKEKHQKSTGEKLGSATLVYNYRVLRSVFTKAKEWKIIKENPLDGVKKPKEEQKEVEVYGEEEVSLILRLLEPEPVLFKSLIILAITTAMRRGELLGLEWKHVDFENGIININQSIPKYKNGQPVIKGPKNKGSRRKVAIPQIALETLREFERQWKKDHFNSEDTWLGGSYRFLFSNENGMPFYPKTIGDKWRSFHKRNSEHGLKYIRFHDLRHTSATLLINEGVHPKIISNRLGHSKIGTTMNVYGHVIDSADKTAAEKFQGLFTDKTKTDVSTHSKVVDELLTDC
ncbi:MULTISPECIES: tyrosine-type recombinase/integrase [Paenibacillus]|uniref:Site-specific integrase n=1 Tax=Paenibacillus taichungensis TaxID=484184 RepID=A0ABX2MJZ8_9BACL|nr:MULTISPECIES: site-specific integrase [Paenibacillus]NUU54367.1 site-specific integrase [Paenibacillus taichungensis]SLJ98401.1 integrase [Paenibacillus sp. RU5A]SOC66766.1 integrase [Paenibacillus sp. RU26A]SOC70085.1 integrase [Paenibacillus sp. RU5M]